MQGTRTMLHFGAIDFGSKVQFLIDHDMNITLPSCVR